MSEAVAWALDALELGEGARWIDGRLYVVDILAGRLLIAAVTSGAHLEAVLRLPVSLGAVAPLAERRGAWVVAAGTGPGQGPCAVRRSGGPGQP